MMILFDNVRFVWCWNWIRFDNDNDLAMFKLVRKPIINRDINKNKISCILKYKQTESSKINKAKLFCNANTTKTNLSNQ